MKREVTKAKQELWDKTCNKVNKYIGGTKVGEAWKLIKQLRTESRGKANIPIINMSKWKEHYEKLLTENKNEYKQMIYLSLIHI